MSKRRPVLRLGAAIVSALLGVWLAFRGASYLPEGTAWLYLYAGALEILMLGIPGLLFLLRQKGNRALFSMPSVEATGMVVLSAAACVLTAVLISAFWVSLLRAMGISLPPEGAMPAAGNMGELAAALLGAALLPAVCEELLFRGVLLRFLLGKLPAVWAALVCALAFALLHLSWMGFAALLMIGLFLSLLVIRYRCLWLAMLFHFLYNALVIVMQSLGGSPSVRITLLSAGVFAACAYLLFEKREAELWN